MISEIRTYHFIGEIFLKRSRVLDKKMIPKDDKVNWLLLNTGERQFSFVYKIQNSLIADYEKSFNIYLSFLMEDAVKECVQLNKIYEVLRGEEKIGNVKLIQAFT